MWPKGIGYSIQPHAIRRMSRRQKKKRRRDKDEIDPNNPNRLRRTGMTMTYSNCHEVEHKNEEVPKSQKVPGKRGRPNNHTNSVRPSNTDSTRPSNTDSSRENGQTMAPDSQTASKKVIAKERAQGSSASGIYYQAPNIGESSTCASTTHLATQESHHHRFCYY